MYVNSQRNEGSQIWTDSPYPKSLPASRLRVTASSQRASGSRSPPLAKPHTQCEKQWASGSQSGPGTEAVIDMEEDYRFHISAEFRKFWTS